MKKVTISEELFTRLYGYHLLGKRDNEQEAIIRQGLQDKLDRIIRRTEYTKYYNNKEDKGHE